MQIYRSRWAREEEMDMDLYRKKKITTVPPEPENKEDFLDLCVHQLK